MSEEDNVFVRITNKDIYHKLLDIEKHVLTTNGNVKVNMLVSRLALLLAGSIILTVAGIKLFNII